MKIVIAGLLSLFASGTFAQDTTSAPFERAAWVVGSSLVFSLADYVGYSAVRYNNHAPFWYRIGESTLQTGLSYILYEKFGLPSAIAFNLIWWSWGDDIGYSGWAYVLNGIPSNWTRQGGVETENRLHNGLTASEDQITWAGWTPIGILRPAHTRIPRDVLIGQAIAGFGISMAILW